MNKLDLIQFVKCASVFGVVWSPVPLVSCVCDNVDDDENNIQGTKTTTTKYLNPFSQKEGEDDEKKKKQHSFWLGIHGSVGPGAIVKAIRFFIFDFVFFE